jgi:type IV secretion system protein TrbL
VAQSTGSPSQAGNAGAGSGSQPASATPSRYHRFPAHSPQNQTGRSGALNAYFAANTARQLLPANENSGSLSPTIREED